QNGKVSCAAGPARPGGELKRTSPHRRATSDLPKSDVDREAARVAAAAPWWVRRWQSMYLTASASVNPFYPMSVSGRTRARTDRFHSMAREEVRRFTVFGPDTTPAVYASM